MFDHGGSPTLLPGSELLGWGDHHRVEGGHRWAEAEVTEGRWHFAQAEATLGANLRGIRVRFAPQHRRVVLHQAEVICAVADVETTTAAQLAGDVEQGLWVWLPHDVARHPHWRLLEGVGQQTKNSIQFQRYSPSDDPPLGQANPCQPRQQVVAHQRHVVVDTPWVIGVERLLTEVLAHNRCPPVDFGADALYRRPIGAGSVGQRG